MITGAGGEIGHGLVTRLQQTGASIITVDLTPLDASLAPLVIREFTGSITDLSLLDRILAEFEVDRVFHLAALLSTRAEFTPVTAHHVNVEGTLNLLEFAQRQGESHGRPVVFVYPSSIAAYGLPDVATKAEDIVFTPDGRFVSPSVLTHPFKPFDQILKSQIIQDAADHVLVKIVPSADFTPEHRKQLEAGLRQRLGSAMRIETQLVDDIPAERSGKFRWVISQVPHPAQLDWTR